MRKTAIVLSLVGFAALLFLSDIEAKNVSISRVENPKRENDTHVLGPCRFQIANIFGGNLVASHSNDTSPQQGIYDLPDSGTEASRVLRSFSMFCRSANPEQIGTALNAEYVSGHWLNSGPVGGPEFVPFDKRAHVQTISLKGTNWTGVAYTADDTTGDERIRARRFHFCLLHGAQALCGDTPVMWLERPGVNDLWKVKAILESVRFHDMPTPADDTPFGR